MLVERSAWVEVRSTLGMSASGGWEVANWSKAEAGLIEVVEGGKGEVGNHSEGLSS